jgi:hypothetical protein
MVTSRGPLTTVTGGPAPDNRGESGGRPTGPTGPIPGGGSLPPGLPPGFNPGDFLRGIGGGSGGGSLFPGGGR